MSYTTQTWADFVSGTPSVNQTANASRMNHLEAGVKEASDRLDTLEAAVAAIGTGPTGVTGAELVAFGPNDDTTWGVTGDIFGPFVAPVAYTIQPNVLATLRGGATSGDTNFDVEICTAPGLAGPWSSIFTTGKPTVVAGARTGISGAPSTTALPAGGALRVKILSAPSGGGTLTWRTPGAVAAGTTTASTLNSPIPTSTTTGDLMVDPLFMPSPSTPSWPSGWSPYGTPFPIGAAGAPDVGPFYMHLATKTAGASESTTQAVTFPAIAASLAGIAVNSGALVVPTSSNVTINGVAGTSAATPSGLTTPVANCILVHLAMPRWTSGNLPSSIGWSGGSLGTSDAQAETNITTAQNTGIAVAHEVQASAGAVTPRTASWTAQARSLTATLIFQPSGGSAPPGPEVVVRIRPVA